MPAREVLDSGQLALLLRLAQLDPHEASPLPPGGPAEADSQAAERLRARGLLVDGADGSRVNTAFREVLAAAAQPEEVLALRVTGPAQPGFAFCRRGRLWTEVASDAAGVTHFAYPLTRNAMVVAAAGALSGDRPEAPPVGFHFRGPAADGLLLNAAAQAGDRGIPADGLAAAVRSHMERHTGAGIATALVDAAGTRALLDGTLAPAIERLRAAGHVEERNGGIVASRRARAVLGVPAEAGFTASRATVTVAGVHTTAIQAWRCRDRNLVTRPVTLADGSTNVDWADYQKAELRALIAAVYAIAPRG